MTLNLANRCIGSHRRRPSRRGPSRLLVAPVVALLLVGGACSSDDGAGTSASTTEPTADRVAVVAKLIDEVVVAANVDAAERAEAFGDAIDDACAAPDEANLAAARAALSEAWAAWEATDSFDIGPVMERRSASVVAYRVDTAKVDAALADTPPVDAQTVRNRTGSGLRGYGAAEHLLVTDPAAYDTPARCDYLSAVAEVIVEETGIIAEWWTDGFDGAPPYRETATGSGDGALSATDVIDSLVNMQISQLEAESKLFSAVVQAGQATPIDLPVAELFTLAAKVDGIVNVYSQLGELLDPELTATIDSQAAALSGLLAPSAGEPTETQPDKVDVEKIATAIDELRATIATEVVSALDVTISFSENDGDS